MALESEESALESGSRSRESGGRSLESEACPSDPGDYQNSGHTDYSRSLSAEVLVDLHHYILQWGLVELKPQKPVLSPTFGSLLNKPLPRKPKAILVDIYGTLLTSGLGELGATEEADPGIQPDDSDRYSFPENFTERLHGLIAEDHAKARAAGIDWPEIDAICVFMRILGLDSAAAAKACVAWECLANPCAAMPGALAFISLCRQASLPLGIVSNAQFYTLLFIQAAFGVDVDILGFDSSLSFWSYRTGRAKPDRFMYDQAAQALAIRGIAAADALYVGNDALNDCAAAGEAGFMTALFAGDARSFRPRDSSPRVAENPPDTVVSGWDMLTELVI